MPIDKNFFKPLNKINGDSTLHPWLLFCQINLLKGWFSRLKSGKLMLNFKKFECRLPDSPWRLPDSPSRGVDDSPTCRVGELATPRLAESGSRQLSDSPSFSFVHSKADSPTRRLGESSTPRLAESESQRLPDSPSRRVGESFFDYEYLREFEAKSRTARKIYEDPISAKTPENPPHCHVPLTECNGFLRRFIPRTRLRAIWTKPEKHNFPLQRFLTVWTAQDATEQTRPWTAQDVV
jgi:hypothetical protein